MFIDNMWLQEFFFFKIKTQLLNVEFAMNPAEILFEDWRETTQGFNDETEHEIARAQLMDLCPGPPSKKCTYKQQVG